MLNWRDPRNPLAGGAERVSEAYLRGLMTRGHEVVWFANHFSGCASEETIGGLRIVRGGGRGTSVLAARKWVRRQPPFDLVIDQHHGIPWFAPWWCQTRCVTYIHEILGPIWSSFYPWPLSMIGRWQESWTHRLYSKVPFWVGSESTRQAILRRGVREVTLVPYGIDTEILPALESKSIEGTLRLVVVSRLAPNKRVDHAIEVARILMNAGTAVELVVVGDGECAALLQKQVSEAKLSSIVRFAGRLGEAAKDDELRKAHFLLHTSVREGWGLNVIEANARGTPAAVYPVPGLVDSTVDGVTGLVSPLETPESLVTSLRELQANPVRYAVLRRQAWERSRTFRWETILPVACDWLEQQARRPRSTLAR